MKRRLVEAADVAAHGAPSKRPASRDRGTESGRAAGREENGHASRRPGTPSGAVCRDADGATRLWVAGQRVVGPNAAGREFTFITRHQLPDGSSAPVMAPEAVRCALERLGLAPLIPTIVGTPTASAPSVLLEVVDLGEKGCGVLAGRDVAAGEAVCDYVGEILSTHEAAARQATYDVALRQQETETETEAEAETEAARDGGAEGPSGRLPSTPTPRRRGMNYLLVLLEHLPTRTVRTSVDPTRFGGVASCINHCCAWSSQLVQSIGPVCISPAHGSVQYWNSVLFFAADQSPWRRSRRAQLGTHSGKRR